ncbi:glycosyltransferase family 4 protein [Massilia sp. 2TAF26]|uniref:glycosyltransferase family 4 protein n=1 Tax=Massilia sp. 2TAF26 TaxID=3233012 RepID=UPI003F987C7D
MKILFVITRSDVMGGASVHMLDLAEGVHASGHEVFILTGGSGILLEKARARNLPIASLTWLVREIRIVSDTLAIFELIRWIKRVKPDVIHLHSSKAGIVGRLAAAWCRIPAVFTAHGWAFTEGVAQSRRALYIFIERTLARFAAAIIAVSNYDRNLALSLNVIKEEKIRTIPNGMPCVPDYVPPPQPAGETRLIMVARFEAPKRQALVLEALARLPVHNWQMEFVGDGPALEACVRRADELGLRNVQFSGACNDVAARLARSHVFVLLSDWEGLPLTIIEAMRAGLPVVASKVGGIPELVEDGVNGRLVDNNAVEDIASAVLELLGSPSKARLLGDNGRQRFLAEYSFDKMRAETLAVYDNVLLKAAA